MIQVNILYHLWLGLDRVLIVDNGSSDGTSRVLQGLSKDPRVRWTRDTGPYRQAEVLTELAREAYQEGAEWILPIEADGFFYSRQMALKEVLAESTAGALRVRVIDFIQRREQRESSPDALRYMTRRVPEPFPRGERLRELIASNRASYVEMARVPQHVIRASANVSIANGAHQVGGVDGPVEETDEIIMLHAPLPSKAKLEAKALLADRASETFPARGFWHLRRWQKLREESALEREWAANSYADDQLDVYGIPRPVIIDPTLCDLLAPWLQR